MTYTIRKRERVEASPKYGLRQGWTEWQVVLGRKVVARFDLERQAQAWIAEQDGGPITSPWRDVVRIEKLFTSGGRRHPTRLTLFCGHTLTLHGGRAWEARYAKRQRCEQCAAQEGEARLQARIAADLAAKGR